MLNASRAVLMRHLQACVYSFQVLLQRPVATFMTVLVIAVALTLPTIFWILSDNFHKITTDWQHKAHLSVYLALHQDAASQKRVLVAVQAIEGIGQVTLKTPEAGLAALEKQEGMHDMTRYLPDNPLPAVIEVIPALTYDTPLKLTQLSSRLQKVNGVDVVKLDLEWVKRLHAILDFVRTFAELMMVLLATAVVLIIGNTLRLAMHHRHEEIQVLKLIGATDAYIMRPFVYSGLWHGLLGAVLAILLVNVFLISLGVAVERLAAIYDMHYPFIGLTVKQAYLLALLSSFLGFIASQCFIRSRLSSIEAGHSV